MSTSSLITYVKIVNLPKNDRTCYSRMMNFLWNDGPRNAKIQSLTRQWKLDSQQPRFLSSFDFERIYRTSVQCHTKAWRASTYPGNTWLISHGQFSKQEWIHDLIWYLNQIMNFQIQFITNSDRDASFLPMLTNMPKELNWRLFID